VYKSICFVFVGTRHSISHCISTPYKKWSLVYIHEKKCTRWFISFNAEYKVVQPALSHFLSVRSLVLFKSQLEVHIEKYFDNWKNRP
jgi:hypothetical protein